MMHLFSKCSLILFSGKHLQLYFIFFCDLSLKISMCFYFWQDLWRLHCKECKGQRCAKKSIPVPAHQTPDGSKASAFLLQAYKKAAILVNDCILTVKPVNYNAKVLYFLGDNQTWFQLVFFFLREKLFYCFMWSFPDAHFLWKKRYILLYLKFYWCTLLYGFIPT